MLLLEVAKSMLTIKGDKIKNYSALSLEYDLFLLDSPSNEFRLHLNGEVVDELIFLEIFIISCKFVLRSVLVRHTFSVRRNNSPHHVDVWTRALHVDAPHGQVDGCPDERMGMAKGAASLLLAPAAHLLRLHMALHRRALRILHKRAPSSD